MTMEITQDALNQLMGFIFIVALIDLAIAVALELIKGKAETIPWSDRSKSPQSITISQPIQDSMLSAMEPVLGWFEHLPTLPISDQTASPNLEERTELPGNELAELVTTELTETVEAAELEAEPSAKPPEAQSYVEAEPHFTDRATEQTAAGSCSPADANDDLDKIQVTTGEAETIVETIVEETPESLTTEFEDRFASQVEKTDDDEASESTPEGAIKPDAPDQEDIRARPPAAEELTECIMAEFEGLFTSQEDESLIDISEEPSIDQSKPYFTDKDVEHYREASSEPMPSEFEDIWTPVGKTYPPSGMTELFEKTELFKHLEALFNPEVEIEYLDQETPTPIAELEELAALDLDELFSFPSEVSPSAPYRSMPIEELDRPTDEELEEIFGAQLKVINPHYQSKLIG